MIDGLIMACAVADAPPAVIREIIQIESGDAVLALNVNGPDPIKLTPAKSVSDAAATAQTYLEQGYTVDIGYMQVNSVHLKRYGVSVSDLLDGCMNIAIGSEIFMKAYRPAVAFYGEGSKTALKSALSAYNTGTFHRGFDNGYVARYDDDLLKDKDATIAIQMDVPKPEQSDTRVEIDFGPGPRSQTSKSQNE